jgi:hypothetical protein
LEELSNLTKLGRKTWKLKSNQMIKVRTAQKIKYDPWMESKQLGWNKKSNIFFSEPDLVKCDGSKEIKKQCSLLQLHDMQSSQKIKMKQGFFQLTQLAITVIRLRRLINVLKLMRHRLA